MLRVLYIIIINNIYYYTLIIIIIVVFLLALCNCSMCIAMTFEGVLRNIFATGREGDTVVQIQCPPLFRMRSVVATRETIWCLCGYGVSPVDI